MLIFKHIIIGIFCFLTLNSCRYLYKKKPLFSKIPQHAIFVNRNTMWMDFKEFDGTGKRLGKNKNDTMIILTTDYMILITGQYRWLSTDTIIIPSTSLSGINYEVLKNDQYNLSADSIITVGKQQFIKKGNTKFEWWVELLPEMKRLGKGNVIITGQ